MKRLFISTLGFIGAIASMAYRRLTWKCYYITGTFMKDKERMYFKMVFQTYGNVLPIKSLESMVANEFNVEKVLILNFHRLPLSMVKYVESDYTESIRPSRLNKDVEPVPR